SPTCPAGPSTNARTGNTTPGGSRRPSRISRRSTVGTRRRCSPGRSPRSRNPWTAVIFRRACLLRKDPAGRRRNSRSKISSEVHHGGHGRPLPVLRMGGIATNFALQIARLGAKTTFVGVLGRDANADLLREAYSRQGVRAIVRTDAAHPTGATVALSWTGGGRALITSLGANGELRLRDVPAKILNQVDHLHRAGFWWTPRLMGRPTALLLSRARNVGVGTSLAMSA